MEIKIRTLNGSLKSDTQSPKTVNQIMKFSDSGQKTKGAKILLWDEFFCFYVKIKLQRDF